MTDRSKQKRSDVDNDVPFPNINLNIEDDENNEQEKKGNTRELRDELLSLAENGKTKYSAKYIKKASHDTLEKIKMDYDRIQLEVTNEFITNNLISKFSELMDSLDFIEDPDQMERELTNNQLLKRDLKGIIGRVTPYIPLVGLLCGGIIVGKCVISKYGNKKDGEQKQQDQQDKTEQGGKGVNDEKLLKIGLGVGKGEERLEGNFQF